MGKKRDLVLHIKGEYFDQIKSGEKQEEYRLDNEYWQKRFSGKIYDRVVIARGYPKVGDAEKWLFFPYRGYTRKEITHKHFGDIPVRVFAIKVAR